MKAEENWRSGSGLDWLRTLLLVMTCLLAALWVSSYFIGFQRYTSKWSNSGGAACEDARWLVSNFGSAGFAWRSQQGDLGAPLPKNEVATTSFDGSSQALNHVHPEGIAAWHWVQYQPVQMKRMGSMETGYGHLYVPYWMPTLASGLLTFAVSVLAARRAGRKIDEDYLLITNAMAGGKGFRRGRGANLNSAIPVASGRG